jgi:hypothetical protein
LAEAATVVGVFVALVATLMTARNQRRSFESLYAPFVRPVETRPKDRELPSNHLGGQYGDGRWMTFSNSGIGPAWEIRGEIRWPRVDMNTGGRTHTFGPFALGVNETRPVIIGGIDVEGFDAASNAAWTFAYGCLVYRSAQGQWWLTRFRFTMPGMAAMSGPHIVCEIGLHAAIGKRAVVRNDVPPELKNLDAVTRGLAN